MLRIGMGEEQGTVDELQMRGLAVLFFTHKIGMIYLHLVDL